MKNSLKILLGLLPLAFLSCNETIDQPLHSLSLELPSTPYNYGPGINNNVPTLGRVLFYDRQLSINNSVSCASCHKQSLAFADDVPFSKGFDNRLTTRNSMPIQNLGIQFADSSIVIDPAPGNQFFPRPLFWDGRETFLPTMVLRPIVNHVEMGVYDLNALCEKLSGVPYYKNLFKKAYGDENITTDRLADALATFVQSIHSDKTKLDRHVREGAPLTAEEMEGKILFFTKYNCNTCHQVTEPDGYLFAGGTFSNIGLDGEYVDNGLSDVSKLTSDAGKFKIPSLRNVALTAPYMHDGRFATLEEVIDHYSEGIADHPNLDERLRDANGGAMKFNITPHEKDAIIAFLHTLTDVNMVTDLRFSDPFKINQ